MALLAERPDVDVLYGGIQFTDEDLVVRRTYIPAAPSFRRYLFFGDYIPTPTFIFRRSLLAGTRACSTSAGSTPPTTTSTCA